MPEYRLILRNSGEGLSEIIDLVADNLDFVLAFIDRQRALLLPPVEVWSNGELLLTLFEI